MSVFVIVDIQVKPENVSDVKELLAETLPDTRAHEGCQGVEVYSNSDNPSNMIFVGRWDSREQQEKYLAWRQETGTMGKFGAMLAGPPNIRYFESVDV